MIFIAQRLEMRAGNDYDLSRMSVQPRSQFLQGLLHTNTHKQTKPLDRVPVDQSEPCPYCVRAYLHGHQCVDAVGKEQCVATSRLPRNPQVQETNAKLTLITEDRLLRARVEEKDQNKCLMRM